VLTDLLRHQDAETPEGRQN